MSSGTADKIIAKITREVKRQNQELSDLDNLVIEKQADIEEYDEMLVALDNKMKGYVFPPTFDFITNTEQKPFAMYIFEFEHTFED